VTAPEISFDDHGAAVAALLDANRLAVAGAVVSGTRSSDDIAATTGLERRVVIAALAELRAAGLVVTDGGGYVLPPERLRSLAAGMAEEATPMDATIGYGMTDDERDVLRRFFSGRTLTQVPTDRPKRLIVLERLALDFDIGRRYSEAEVDDVLRGFHLDVAALRRHLVDEELLSRERSDGQTRYWRSGGRVPVPSMA